MEGRYPRVLPVIFILYIFNMKKSYIYIYIQIEILLTITIRNPTQQVIKVFDTS